MRYCPPSKSTSSTRDLADYAVDLLPPPRFRVIMKTLKMYAKAQVAGFATNQLFKKWSLDLYNPEKRTLKDREDTVLNPLPPLECSKDQLETLRNRQTTGEEDPYFLDTAQRMNSI